MTVSPSTVVSDAAGLTSADRYCWRAEFSGDDDVGVPGSQDSSAGECFTVDAAAADAGHDRRRGRPGRLRPADHRHDLAHRDRRTSAGTDGIGPGGTINATNRRRRRTAPSRVTAFGPDSCTTVAHGPIDAHRERRQHRLRRRRAATLEFTPTAPGLYVYVASYSGDSPEHARRRGDGVREPAGDRGGDRRGRSRRRSRRRSAGSRTTRRRSPRRRGNLAGRRDRGVRALYGRHLQWRRGTPKTVENCQAAVHRPGVHEHRPPSRRRALGDDATNNTTVAVSASGRTPGW